MTTKEMSFRIDVNSSFLMLGRPLSPATAQTQGLSMSNENKPRITHSIIIREA